MICRAISALNILYGLTETGRALEAILFIVPVGLSLSTTDADGFRIIFRITDVLLRDLTSVKFLNMQMIAAG